MRLELLATGNVVVPALVGVVGSVITLVVTGLCLWAWRQLKNQFTAGHEENKKTLAAILSQAQQTNGRVNKHEEDIVVLKSGQAALNAVVFRRAPAFEEEA